MEEGLDEYITVNVKFDLEEKVIFKNRTKY